MTRFLYLSILLIALLLLSGCGSTKSMREELALTKTEFSKVSLLQLQEMLKDFGERFAFSVKGAANHIVEQSPDLVIRKRTVYWKLVTIPNLRRSIFTESPLVGLVDSWAFCVQMVDFFETGDGKDAFGDLTEIVLETSRALETDITGIAERALKEEYYGEWKDAIETFAMENPLHGLFVRHSTRPVLLQASEAGKLSWVTSIPLAPFRAVMSDTAKAIAEFTMVADRFENQLSFLPDRLHWQMELLLYDIEERETTRTAMSSVKEVADSTRTFTEAAQEFTKTIENMPGDIESRVRSVLDDFDQKQEGIQGSLKEAQAVAADVNKAVAGIQDTVIEVEKTVADVQVAIEKADDFSRSATQLMGDVATAGEKWESTVRVFHEVVKELSPEEEEDARASAATADDSEPFDVKDLARTAERTQAAVAELRSLNKEVRAFLDSGSAGALVRQIVLYLIILVAAFFGILLAYRFTARRLVAKG